MKKQTFYILMLNRDKSEYFVEPVEGYPCRQGRWKWDLFVYQSPGAGWFICEARTGLSVGLYGYKTMKEAIQNLPKAIDRLERLSQNKHFMKGYEKNVEIFAVAMNTYKKMEEMSNGETT